MGTGDKTAGKDYWSNTLFSAYNSAQTVFQNGERARKDDPVGVNTVGATPKKLADGTPIIEHPQTTYGNGGDSIKLNDASATSHHAILWAGDPNGYRHYNDIKDAYNRLKSDWAGTTNTISVLFGDGMKNANGEDLPAEWNAKAATQENLQNVIDGLQEVMGPTEQFLFFSSDHGGTESDIIDTPVLIDGSHWIAQDIHIYEGEFTGMLQTPDNIPYLDVEGMASAGGQLLYGFFGRDHVLRFDGVTIDAPGSFQKRLLLSNYEDVMLGGMFVPGDEEAGFFLQFFGNGGGSATIDSFAFGTGAINNSIDPVPEPFTLVGLGGSLLWLVRRRRSRS